MYIRIVSAVIGLILLALIVQWGGWFFTVAICILNMIALWELNRAFKHINMNIALIKSFLCALVLQLSAFTGRYMLSTLFLVFFVIILFIDNIIHENIDGIPIIVNTVFALVYTSVPLMYWIYLRNLPQGLVLTWWVFIVTWFSDIGAYFVGCSIGTKKLAPAISPNKTIEGSMGGLFSSLLASIIFTWRYIPGLTYGQAALLGVLVGTTSQIGDLSASVLKRHFKIKDFSNILPGHGGILDRFDSALFSFPLAYYYITILIRRGVF